MSLPTPNTRKEQYLNAIATGNAGGLPTPITREEEYLDAIAKSGGGSGDGDMKKSVYDSDLAVSEAGGIKAFVNSAVAGKVDKVEGKGLSTNDYDDTEKGKVADNTAAIEVIENVTGAKNLWNLGEIFTANAGGTYTFNNGTLSVVSSGSAYSGVYRDIANDISNDVKNTPIIISFDYKADADINAYIGIANVSVETTATTNFKHFELSVDSFSSMASTTLVIYDGTTTSHTITVKNFMIRDARIKDSTYVPYAMTNRELTDAVNRGSVSVTADGVKTYQVLLHELFNLSSKNTIIQYRDTIRIEFPFMVARYSYNNLGDDKCYFSMTAYSATAEIFCVTLSGTLADVRWGYWDGSSYNDMSQLVPSSGAILRLVY